jgi:segregation and condensation protein A
MLMDTELNTDFKVRVGQFEGPIELLLDLIEKRKLHISEVSLAKVADEFIEYTKSLEEASEKKKYVADLADFILVASTLLLIKSKSLLPALDLTEEERGSIEDLEKRLAQYKKYKELAAGLGKMFGNFLYFAEERKEAMVFFHPSQDLSLESLHNALLEALRNAPVKTESIPKVTVEKIISLEEMIDNLSKRVETSLKTSFKNFSNIGKAKKVDVIVSFLAMLELVKRGAVRVSQSKHFEDIEIESEETGIPKYY